MFFSLRLWFKPISEKETSSSIIKPILTIIAINVSVAIALNVLVIAIISVVNVLSCLKSTNALAVILELKTKEEKIFGSFLI